MKKILIFLLLFSVAYAKDRKAPLPSELLRAKTVYLDDQGGYAATKDRTYEVLQQWGRFTVVSNPADADVIVRLSTKTTSGGTGIIQAIPNTNIALTSEDSDRYTTLAFISPKSGEILWSDTHIWCRSGATKVILKEFRRRIEEEEKNRK
jgi:hypothetical protein